MKKILLLLALVMVHVCRTEVPVVELKGATEAMKPGYESISPAVGALYWYSSFMRNIYLYAPESETNNFIHELYNMLTDGITFDCTNSYTRIARYLTPKDMGALVGITASSPKISEENFNQVGQFVERLKTSIINSSEDKGMQKIAIEKELKSRIMPILALVKKIEILIEKRKKISEIKDLPFIQERLAISEAETEIRKLEEEVAKLNSSIRKLQENPEKAEAISKVQSTLGPTVNALKLAKDKYQRAVEALNKKSELPQETIQEKQHEQDRQRIESELSKASKNLNEQCAILNKAFLHENITLYMDKLLSDRAFLERIQTTFIDGLKTTISRQITDEEKVLQKIAAISKTLPQEAESQKKILDADLTKVKKAMGLNNAIIEKHTQFIKEKPNEIDFSIIEKLSVAALVKSLVASFYEEGIIFPEGTVSNILMAFAWKKATNRDDFMSFYDGYAAILGLDNRTAIIDAARWHDLYTEQNYDALNSTVINTIDGFVFFQKGYEIFKSKLPENVSMVGSVPFAGTTFPDCGETSLRNFLNLLLYDEHKKFNVELLEKLGAVSEFIKFYKTFPDCTGINTLASHIKWADVVSNQPEINYSSSFAGKHFDLDTRPTGPENMQNLIKKLIPGIDSWATLQATLKKLGITFTFEQKQNGLNNYTLKFSIAKAKETQEAKAPEAETGQPQKEASEKVEFVWQFEPGHFELNFGEKRKPDNYVIQSLVESMIPEIMRHKQAILGLLGAKPQGCTFMSQFFISTRNFEEKIELISGLEKCQEAGKNKRILESIKKIIKTLPHDGELFFDAYQVLSTEISGELLEFLTNALQGDKTQRDIFISLVIGDMFANPDKTIVWQDKKESSFNWSIDQIESITTDDAIANIVTAVISKKPTEKKFEQIIPIALKKFGALTKADAIEDIIEELISNIEERADLIAPFIVPAANMFKNIHEQSSILAIINKLFSTIDPETVEQLQPLIEIAAAKVNEIQDEPSRLNIITKALDYTTPAMIKYLRPLIETAAAQVRDSSNNEFILAAILKAFSQITPETVEQLQPLIDVAALKLEKNTDPKFIAHIVKLLISEKALNPAIAPRFAKLRNLAAKKFSEIAETQFENADNIEILNAVIDKLNPETVGLLAPFMETIAKQFNKMHDLDRSLISQIIYECLLKIGKSNQVDKQLDHFIPIMAEKFKKIQDSAMPRTIELVMIIIEKMGKTKEIDTLLRPLIEAAADEFTDNQFKTFMRYFITGLQNRTSVDPVGISQFIKLAAEKFKQSRDERFIVNTINGLIKSINSETNEIELSRYAPFITAAAFKFNDLQKISYISIIVQTIFDKIGESTIPDKVLTYYEPFIKIAAEKFKAIQDPSAVAEFREEIETVIQKYPNNAALLTQLFEKFGNSPK